MAIQKLPTELTSLVHHVELNKAGWWDKAQQQLLIAAIWVSGRDQSILETVGELKKSFQVDITVAKAEAHVDKLLSKGILMRMPQERFKISERFLERYETDIRETEILEKAVEESFAKILIKHCPSLDVRKAWTDFYTRFLLPFVRDVGANTYKLLSEGNLRITPARFARFVRMYPVEIHEPFAEVVKEFLDPKNTQLRSYILRSLNAYFFIESSSLTEKTIEALVKLSGAPPSFNVFVDTNFLFSILGLVPSASDGRALVELISRLQGRISVKLYALPLTVDEAKRKLISTKQRLAGLRIIPNLAEAASKMNLDSLQVKFFEESPKRGLISAEEYFEPYINDLISMMRSKGVELYNEDVEKYKTEQNVIDDILFQLESEKKKYKERAKNYEKLEHDMVLWHVAKNHRPVRIESPLDALYWVATIDYRMLGFDKFKKRVLKKRGQESLIPVCLYPTTLIQMLQFWIPRTPEFEEAMLSSMRLPFFYQEFDVRAEKVTLDILKTLSQYEGVEDMQTSVISSILVNTALRDKMSVTKDVEKKVRLIKEALIEKHNRTTAELRALAERLRLTEEELAIESSNKRAAEVELAGKTSDLGVLQKMVEDLTAASVAEKEALSSRLSQLEDSALAKDQQVQLARDRRLFLLKWVIVPLLLVIAVLTPTTIVFSKLTSWSQWRTMLAFYSAGVMLWAAILDWRGSKDPNVNEWPPFTKFKRLRKWIFTILGALILGVVANFVYDWIKSLKSSG